MSDFVAMNNLAIYNIGAIHGCIWEYIEGDKYGKYWSRFVLNVINTSVVVKTDYGSFANFGQDWSPGKVYLVPIGSGKKWIRHLLNPHGYDYVSKATKEDTRKLVKIIDSGKWRAIHWYDGVDWWMPEFNEANEWKHRMSFAEAERHSGSVQTSGLFSFQYWNHYHRDRKDIEAIFYVYFR